MRVLSASDRADPDERYLASNVGPVHRYGIWQVRPSIRQRSSKYFITLKEYIFYCVKSLIHSS